MLIENEWNIEYKTRGVQNRKQKIEKQKMELKIRIIQIKIK